MDPQCPTGMSGGKETRNIFKFLHHKESNELATNSKISCGEILLQILKKVLQKR